MPSKISMIIKAGQKLEETKTGFTVPDLMDLLKWDEGERLYLRNAMSQLTRKGITRKLGPNRPVVYSFKKKNKKRTKKPSIRGQGREIEASKGEKSLSGFSLDDFSQMDISPELAGQGVLYLISQLKEKNEALEAKILAAKQQLDDAAAKIDEQNAIIQKQAATIEALEKNITNLKKNERVLTRLKCSPIIQKKKTLRPGRN